MSFTLARRKTPRTEYQKNASKPHEGVACVAFDVKHIYAWVKENNPRAYVPDRYDKTLILPGDPDCKLGVKRSTNKELPDGTTEEKKELLWRGASNLFIELPISGIGLI